MMKCIKNTKHTATSSSSAAAAACQQSQKKSNSGTKAGAVNNYNFPRQKRFIFISSHYSRFIYLNSVSVNRLIAFCILFPFLFFIIVLLLYNFFLRNFPEGVWVTGTRHDKWRTIRLWMHGMRWYVCMYEFDYMTHFIHLILHECMNSTFPWDGLSGVLLIVTLVCRQNRRRREKNSFLHFFI